MKAFLFSKGETTTDLSDWSLRRQGFDVVKLYDLHTTFYKKYLEFLEMARGEEVVVRMDADVIVTKGINDLVAEFMDAKRLYFASGQIFCFLRYDLITGAPHLMSEEAVEIGLKRMKEWSGESRPETSLTRCPEFYEPVRRYDHFPVFTGLHAFEQSEEDVARVMEQKARRGQLGQWDMGLVGMLDKLKEQRRVDSN